MEESPPYCREAREDLAAIHLAVTRAAEGGVPLRGDELQALIVLLRGHVELLLPAVSAGVGRLWRGGIEWYNADMRLAAVRRRLENGPGSGLSSAQQHVVQLARDVAWMLEVTAVPEGDSW
ncbi:hypothetical protein F0L17_14295 [Streptomyces sp. TRM43335]|uniref:Uncharacterized protein n=1 Tax=Streptomyces taklimakanensis TaxID=2569853 RepID=A0A6G2BDC8_9ACTN|nr:hypothetical protein [Streptomyces taklimakanensis]